MNRDLEIKKHILNLLRNFMLEESGKKIKPKAISVEMIGKPEIKEGSLEDVLKDASKTPIGEEKFHSNMDDMEGGEFEDENLDDLDDTGYHSEDDMEGGEENKKAKKMTLKEFLASK